MSRTHKYNFSVPTLHGAQSAVILGSHHPEPKSLCSSGRVVLIPEVVAVLLGLR